MDWVACFSCLCPKSPSCDWSVQCSTCSALNFAADCCCFRGGSCQNSGLFSGWRWLMALVRVSLWCTGRLCSSTLRRWWFPRGRARWGLSPCRKFEALSDPRIQTDSIFWGIALYWSLEHSAIHCEEERCAVDSHGWIHRHNSTHCLSIWWRTASKYSQQFRISCLNQSTWLEWVACSWFQSLPFFPDWDPLRTPSQHLA